MQVLDETQTRSALPFDKLIPALDAGFRSHYESPLRHHHFLANETEPDAVLLLMPAWLDREVGGVKLVNVVPGNAERGLAAISSSYVLFDRETGRHLLIVDGGELTARRTAAASALAAKRIARPDSKTLLVVGTGRVGRNIPYAYRAVLGIERVLLFNRTADKARDFAPILEDDGFEVEVVENLEQGARKADVVSCSTLSKEPIIRGEWLSAGQHLDLIGSFTPDRREADDEAIRRADVFIDTDHAMVESGDIATPLKGGVLREEDIVGTLLDLCRRDETGRRRADQITLFKSVGSAIEDLAAARLAYESIKHAKVA